MSAASRRRKSTEPLSLLSLLLLLLFSLLRNWHGSSCIGIVCLCLSLWNPVVASAWTAEWIDLTTQPKRTPMSLITPPRSGHVAFVLSSSSDNDNDNDDKEKAQQDEDVYVFGGYAEESPSNRYPVNDLWKWDNHETEWKPVVFNNNNDDDDDDGTNKRLPQPRLASAAASIASQNTAFLFGGWDSQQAGTGGVILQDIWSFGSNSNSNNKEWEKTSVDFGLPTSRLVAVAINETTVLVHNHRCQDHVLLYDDGGSLIQQPVHGEAPSPRGLHAATKLLNSNTLVVFGGAAQDGNMSNEVFTLDLIHWKWTKRKTIVSKEEDVPTPRASPCVCALDDTCCIVFGGADRSKEQDGVGLHGCDDLWLLTLLDNGDCSWELLSTEITPPGRNAATLTKLSSPPSSLVDEDNDKNSEDGDNNNNLYFLLSGGWYPFQTTHADAFVLKLSKTQS